GREDVVIELEPGHAEEAHDDERPEPQQPLPAFDRLIRSEPAENVDAPSDSDDAPWEERAGERADVERVIDRARGELDRLRDVPEIACKQVPLHEFVAESPLHPKKPRGGRERHDWQ